MREHNIGTQSMQGTESVLPLDHALATVARKILRIVPEPEKKYGEKLEEFGFDKPERWGEELCAQLNDNVVVSQPRKFSGPAIFTAIPRTKPFKVLERQSSGRGSENVKHCQIPRNFWFPSRRQWLLTFFAPSRLFC